VFLLSMVQRTQRRHDGGGRQHADRGPGIAPLTQDHGPSRARWPRCAAAALGPPLGGDGSASARAGAEAPVEGADAYTTL